ncbi:hypothetical protein BJV78DRAFT_150445 [Lactifluus subvellereus]|nr:hypothetical protein BJV78DRAFT_150445 [Lactifluus subvellereus]
MTWEIKVGLIGKCMSPASRMKQTCLVCSPRPRLLQPSAPQPYIYSPSPTSRSRSTTTSPSVPQGKTRAGRTCTGNCCPASRGSLRTSPLLALGRAVGPNEEGDVVGDAEREERARGLVFEDAIPGVQAGKRAGMNVVWVPDENLLSVQSSQVTEQPDQVLRSLKGLVPEEWGLPPYDDMAAQQSRTE